MSDALSEESLQLGSVAVDHLGVLRRRHTGDVLGERDVEDVAPLLEGLIAALRADQTVSQTVVDLHAWAAAGVSGVRVADKGAPLLGGVLEALCAGLVGAEGGGGGRAGEAGVGGARVGGAGLEDLGVGAGHDVGHHAAGGGAHDEDLGAVGLVLVDGVVDHVDDAEGVAACAVGQTGGVLHVPAVGLVRRAGVDEDEAARVGEGRELGSAVPALGGAAARVKLEGG